MHMFILILAAAACAASAGRPPLTTVVVELADVNGDPINRDQFTVSLRLHPVDGDRHHVRFAALAAAQASRFFNAGIHDDPTFELRSGSSYVLLYTLTDVTTGYEVRGQSVINTPPATDNDDSDDSDRSDSDRSRNSDRSDSDRSRNSDRSDSDRSDRRGGRGGGRGRNRRSIFTFPIFVSLYLSGTSHYQVVTVWRKEAGNARCDFDSVLTYPHQTTCSGCVVDSNDNGCSFTYGYCYDFDLLSWPWPSASLQGDDACGGTQSSSGKEVIDIIEPGTGTYKHLIYANKNEGDFTGSLAQVHVYRKTLLGDIEEIAASYVEDIGTFNGDHRFFHTLEITLDTPNNSYSVTNVDSVECDPTTTTGSDSLLGAEKKYNSAGLERNCDAGSA